MNIEKQRKRFWELRDIVDTAKAEIARLNKKLDTIAEREANCRKEREAIRAAKEAFVKEAGLPDLEAELNFLGRALGTRTAPRPE